LSGQADFRPLDRGPDQRDAATRSEDLLALDEALEPLIPVPTEKNRRAMA
jgi:hypothetical protein